MVHHIEKDREYASRITDADDTNCLTIQIDTIVAIDARYIKRTDFLVI